MFGPHHILVFISPSQFAVQTISMHSDYVNWFCTPVLVVLVISQCYVALGETKTGAVVHLC